MNVFFLSPIVTAALHHIPWQKEKNGEVKSYLTYNNNNSKQKNTFIWWTYIFYLKLLWLCFIILHERRKNGEVLKYLTYSNNNRKQKITLSSDERVSYICDCYGLCFIIFHKRRKNGEVLKYITYSNNNRKQKITL